MRMNNLLILILIASVMVGCARRPVSEGIETNAENAPSNQSTLALIGCNNIFYPLRQDNQWTYQLQFEGTPIGEGRADMLLRVADERENSSDLLARSRTMGIESMISMRCEDGAVVDFPIIEPDALFSEVEAGINVTYESGVFMPSEREFNEADWKNQWTTLYQINGQFEGYHEGETIKAVFNNSTARIDWEVVSTGGQMQVAAGEFMDVVHIHRIIAIQVTSLQAVISGMPVKVGTTLTLATNMYYAPAVGLLKQDLESASVKLPFGIKYPIQGSGSMELITYRLQD